MKLREYRERVGLRQVDVAKKLNVNQTAVSKWENGGNPISRKYQKKLAKLYGITVDELLSEDQGAGGGGERDGSHFERRTERDRRSCGGVTRAAGVDY